MHEQTPSMPHEEDEEDSVATGALSAAMTSAASSTSHRPRMSHVKEPPAPWPVSLPNNSAFRPRSSRPCLCSACVVAEHVPCALPSADCKDVDGVLCARAWLAHSQASWGALAPAMSTTKTYCRRHAAAARRGYNCGDQAGTRQDAALGPLRLSAAVSGSL